MALLRLLRPGWIIPAVSALNLAGQSDGEGYRRGLRTGANLVTMNLTPSDQRGDYLLYRRDRYIMTEERILTSIAAEGLAPSTWSMTDYLHGSSPTCPTPARRTTAQPTDPVAAAP
jgi:biotin synthase